MKTALDAAKTCCALLGMSVAFSVAVIAAPEDKTPQLSLVSTDTNEAFPFAAIQFKNKNKRKLLTVYQSIRDSTLPISKSA